MENCLLTEQDLLKLTDYVLLNSCSVSSSGFYNGKAGMSLSLFEVAHYLKNEELEDKAFDLIQESLLTKNEDIGFENGLSGVGYVFLQLIHNEYIDADFKEFFGKQTDTVLQVLENRKLESPFMLQSFPIVLFLNFVKQSQKDARIDNLLYLLFEEMERFLSIRLFHFESIANNIDRMEVPLVFSTYLQYALETNYPVSPTLIDTYITLYQKGRILSSYSVGFYLDKSGNNSFISEVANENKTNALVNLNPSFLSLRELLDHLIMLRTDHNRWSKYGISLEKQLIDKEDSGLEKSLLAAFPPGTYHAGYGFGIARFLSYCTKHCDLMDI